MKRTADVSPQEKAEPADDSGLKKTKLEEGESNEPSRVVHFRSLPSEATELDVINLGKPFGDLTNLVLVKKKNQAILELADLESAQRLVDYYNRKPEIRKGRQIYVQFSNRKEMKTDSGGNFGAEAALQAARHLKVIEHEKKCTLELSPDVHEKKILRVIVDHTNFPVNIDILYEVFSKHGEVHKMVAFNKNKFPNQFQALIEMADPLSAQVALLKLDGENIYNGCCTLRIEFSKMTGLSIKYNNDKTRDFTKRLPSGEEDYDRDRYDMPRGMRPELDSRYRDRDGPENSVVIVSNLNDEIVTPDYLFTLFGVYGDVLRVKVLYQKKDTALIQFTDSNGADLAIQHLNNLKIWGRQIRINQSKHRTIQMPKDGLPEAHLTRDYSGSHLHRFRKTHSKNHHNIYPPSTTLHLSNIAGDTDEREMRELLSQYGSIRDFKFLPGKDRDRKDRKMALVQMETIEEAVIALINLHDYQLAETAHLRVSFSRARNAFQTRDEGGLD